ncbi:hypothetical protein Tco_0980064 [Tanacetum coccineum]
MYLYSTLCCFMTNLVRVKDQQSLLSPNTHLLLLHHLNHNPLYLNQHITTTSSPHPQETQIPQTTSSIPYDSPLPGVARVTSLETELKKTKEVHGKALTKLVKKVKRLEDKLKSTNEGKKAKIVISNEEEELVLEDSSKQGRMEETEYADVEEENAGVEYDFDLTEQQVTPLKTPQVKEQSQETFEAELSVLSAAKILVETSKERVKTYNRRRRSTAVGLFSTAEDIQDTDEELAKKVQEEEQTKVLEVLEQQEQERANLEAALNLQKLFDQERKAADDIAWSKIVEQAQLKSSGVRNITKAYQGFKDMLKAFDKEYFTELSKEKFRSVEPTEDGKSSMVHHVFSTRGHCIYMLLEKDYPLTTAVMMLILSRRL